MHLKLFEIIFKHQKFVIFSFCTHKKWFENSKKKKVRELMQKDVFKNGLH